MDNVEEQLITLNMSTDGDMIVQILILIYIFFGFSVISEHFLVPTVIQIKDDLKISERLAGSTFIAIGGCLSEMVSNMQIVLLDKPSEFNMGLTGVIGATIFEMTVGLGIGSMLVCKSYKLSYLSIVRDVLLYTFTLIVLFLVLDSREITFSKSLGMIIIWIFFCLYLYFSSDNIDSDLITVSVDIEREKENLEITVLTDDLEKSGLVKWDANNSIIISRANFDSIILQDEIKNNFSDDDKNQCIANAPNFNKNNFDSDYNNKCYLNNKNDNLYATLTKEEIFKLKKRLKYLEQYEMDLLIVFYGIINGLTEPWKSVLKVLMPCANNIINYFVRITICIFVIWLVCTIEVTILENIISKFNLTSAFVGTTILSWGNNIPSLFNIAYAMKKGMVEMSFNAIIASDIHSILIGLGSSWFAYNIKYGKSIPLDKSIGFIKYCIFYYIFFMMAFLAMLYYNKLRMNHAFAIFLFFTYLIFIIFVSTMTIPIPNDYF